jgi:hypothetical protein
MPNRISKAPNGQLKKYLLDDGRVVNVIDVADSVPCSVSLARARLNTTSDPEDVFRKRHQRVGHKYVQIAQAKKLEKKESKEKPTEENKPEKTHYRDGTIMPINDLWLKMVLRII